MPFLLEVEAAAAKIIRGIDRGSREVRFPWPMVAVVRLLRAMPDCLFDVIAARLRRPVSRS